MDAHNRDRRGLGGPAMGCPVNYRVTRLAVCGHRSPVSNSLTVSGLALVPPTASSVSLALTKPATGGPVASYIVQFRINQRPMVDEGGKGRGGHGLSGHRPGRRDRLRFAGAGGEHRCNGTASAIA